MSFPQGKGDKLRKAKEKAKNKGGRPSKYKPEFCDLTRYLGHCKARGDLPSICGYAVYLGVAEGTLDNWGKKNKEFLRSLGILKTISKQALINKGLKGTYSSTIAKLILSSDHGMTERTDQTSGDKPIAKELTLSEMKARIKALENAGDGIPKD